MNPFSQAMSVTIADCAVLPAWEGLLLACSFVSLCYNYVSFHGTKQILEREGEIETIWVFLLHELKQALLAHTRDGRIPSNVSRVVRVPDSWSKGPRFKSLQEWWENFHLHVQLPVPTFFDPFHPHFATAACKRSQSFYQKCRRQVTDKHTCTLVPMWLWMKWHCWL